MTRNIKVLILEDEKLNTERIKRLLHEIRSDVEILGALTSIKKTVDWLSRNDSPDLILMDVKLADGLSFEVFKLTEIKCPVIFTTAYDEFAIKAFKYNSIDYLLKPIDKDELESALLKFERTTGQLYLKKPIIEELIAKVQPKNYRTRFLVPFRNGFKKTDVEDIAFFYSSENICYANLFKGEKVVIPHTLESLEKELEPKLFFRANRQFIVHINSIENVHNYFNGKLKLNLKGNKNIDVLISRPKAPLFKIWLDY